MQAPDLLMMRKKTLEYIESMRVKKSPYGQYRYCATAKEPILYASTYAAMARHLCRDLDSISERERKEWVSYIQSFQTDDGLFTDPAIEGEGWYTEEHMEWCGWRHLTCHVIIALTGLGSVCKKRFRVLEPFFDNGYMMQWLEKRDLENRPDFVGNEILNIATLLRYARDFHNETRAANTIQLIFDWLDKEQDPHTGMWGRHFETKADINRVYQGAYHHYLLYFYDKREFKYINKIIDVLLSLQTEQGGFGIHKNTNGCEDIDAIDPLARLYTKTDYRHRDIEKALLKATTWILSSQNKDGGFVFVRDEEQFYGHNLMYSGRNQSATFPTWWRLLSLAIIAKALPDSQIGKFNWQFTNCPGMQFWKGNTI